MRPRSVSESEGPTSSGWSQTLQNGIPPELTTCGTTAPRGVAVHIAQQQVATILGGAVSIYLPDGTLLEPVVNMEITIPEQYMGDITGDLNGRRGRVLGMDRPTANTEEGIRIIISKFRT